MGFIAKYLLPKQIDFNARLLAQAKTSCSMIKDLYQACVSNDSEALLSIANKALLARNQKVQNMQELLDVFITPYDKESIYRMIVQLDWVSLSVKHFQLESEVYQLHSLAEYQHILKVLLNMGEALEWGITLLAKKDIKQIAKTIEQISEQYDQVVEDCARATGQLLLLDDARKIIRHKDMLLQLKEIAKRIHLSANTLEDMAIKVS